MSKSLKFFLVILAIISVGLSASIIFDWKPFVKRKSVDILNNKQLNNKQNVLPTLIPEKETVITLQNQETKFKMPLEEKYLDLVFSQYPKQIFLSFNLESGVEIRSIFSGEVLTSVLIPERETTLGRDPEANIIWIKGDNGLRAEYFFLGERLIKEGDKITEGTVLGKVKEGSLASRKNSNFSLIIVNEEGQMVELSRDLF